MSTRELLARSAITARKAAFFENFWEGHGPFPILFAKPHLAKGKNWLSRTIAEQHADPKFLLEEALAVAEYSLQDIDDGIPVARADLGTTLFPSFLGLPVHVEEDVHPWPAEHWSLDKYAGMREVGASLDVAATISGAGDVGELPTAVAFYRNLMERIEVDSLPLPYAPDNQGIFDLSHIIVGTDLFYDLSDAPDTVHAAQENSLALYLAGTRLFKNLAGEPRTSMLHGHGMPSGVWFPDIGARVSEDSCTLLSPDAIREFCVPYLERAAEAFGGLFLHFCGHHEDFLRMSAGENWARVINLGNPESYDLDELFALCGDKGTVYFGHLDPGEDEDDDRYLERMAELAGRHGTGLILVAPPYREPDRQTTVGGVGDEQLPGFSEERCRLLCRRWHKLTSGMRFKRA